MGKESKIAWCTHTFNPWIGCTKISPACDHCYAETWANRYGVVTWDGPRKRTSKANWSQPLKWNAAVTSEALRPLVFCASLADVFDNEVPSQWREDLFHLIRNTPRLQWLLLTKRIGNVPDMLPSDWESGYQNVALGITVVTQNEFLRDFQKLRAVPAFVRFLSCEPLLEAMDLETFGSLEDLHWVIVGGESGRLARPLRPRWVESLLAQCRRQRIAFFMKQGSEANWSAFRDFETFPEWARVREFPAQFHVLGRNDSVRAA